MLLLHFVLMVLTVAVTVLLIVDWTVVVGPVTLYPLGNLSDELPENPRILLNAVSVNGRIL